MIERCAATLPFSTESTLRPAAQRLRSANRFLIGFTILLLQAVGCAASFDPALKASVDRQVAALEPSAQTYPAPTVEMPAPLAPGQWIRSKRVDSDGKPSFLTQKIVGQSGSAFWVET